MITFNSLATLAGDEFEWLLENVQRYLAIQSLPCGWIASEQIRQVMARALRQPNTLSFLKSYHKHEFQISDNKEQHVRKRTGDETPPEWKMSTGHHPRMVKIEVRRHKFNYIHESDDIIWFAEMKYMFSNAPAGIISTLPEPFKKAVENSQLWKWERKHRLTKTGCLGTLFPRDEMQDVSLTI
ncbi:hypothetical protein BDFG_01017 [Blastomyces dermatitidis ATCC 26199]|nr:hypothetical protein BDFG_01017 [Blastomyces dermatitidis ATCC 26199]